MLAPQVNIASRAARQAGKIIRRAAEDVSTLTVQKKGMNDFVTEVDRASEQAIIEILRKAYPDHSILGEESGLIEGHGLEEHPLEIGAPGDVPLADGVVEGRGAREHPTEVGAPGDVPFADVLIKSFCT